VTAPRYRRYPSETRAAMLVEAGLACLARGGIQAFTVDNICTEANASRGLITHHFGSKDGLLAACYGAMYDRVMAALEPAQTLRAVVDAGFAPEVFNPESLRIWLALWGEIAQNEQMRQAHRRLYGRYRARVTAAVAQEAEARGRVVDAERVAVMFIALSDGVWLEQGIDPEMMSAEAGRTACIALLEAWLGPLDMDVSPAP
jgi:AcrR family transcriptional regulator